MKADKEPKGKGVNLDPDNQVGGAGMGPGPGATAVSHKWGWFDYQGQREKVPALLVEMERGGETSTEAYTCGKGWKPSADGSEIIPRAGQTGLQPSCKAAKYLAHLRDDCKMPKGTVAEDITVLDGISGTLSRVTLPPIEGKPQSALVFTSLDVAPWIKGGKKAKAAAKPEADDDDDDDDDDDEEAPAPKAKAKAKAKPAADDDDDDDDDDGDTDDEDVAEEAGEAIIAALTEDSPIKLANLEGLVLAQVKKHPNKKAIVAWAITPKNLATDAGWTWDAKKKTVSLADDE